MELFINPFFDNLLLVYTMTFIYWFVFCKFTELETPPLTNKNSEPGTFTSEFH